MPTLSGPPIARLRAAVSGIRARRKGLAKLVRTPAVRASQPPSWGVDDGLAGVVARTAISAANATRKLAPSTRNAGPGPARPTRRPPRGGPITMVPSTASCQTPLAADSRSGLTRAGTMVMVAG